MAFDREELSGNAGNTNNQAEGSPSLLPEHLQNLQLQIWNSELQMSLHQERMERMAAVYDQILQTQNTQQNQNNNDKNQNRVLTYAEALELFYRIPAVETAASKDERAKWLASMLTSIAIEKGVQVALQASFIAEAIQEEQRKTEQEISKDKEYVEVLKAQIRAIMRSEEQQYKEEQIRLLAVTSHHSLQETLDRALAMHEECIALCDNYLKLLDENIAMHNKHIEDHDEHIEASRVDIEEILKAHLNQLNTHKTITFSIALEELAESSFSINQDTIVDALRKEFQAKLPKGLIHNWSDITKLFGKEGATPIIAKVIIEAYRSQSKEKVEQAVRDAIYNWVKENFAENFGHLQKAWEDAFTSAEKNTLEQAISERFKSMKARDESMQAVAECVVSKNEVAAEKEQAISRKTSVWSVQQDLTNNPHAKALWLQAVRNIQFESNAMRAFQSGAASLRRRRAAEELRAPLAPICEGEKSNNHRPGPSNRG